MKSTGLKTGRVSKVFGIDPKTIYSWVDRYSTFFSAEALAEDTKYRRFHPEDMIVLNTIQSERADGTGWDELQIKLESGYRNDTLPPEATTIEGETALALYVRLNALQARLDLAENERERLIADGKAKDETIGKLNREIGKWQARYEILKEQLEEKDDES